MKHPQCESVYGYVDTVEIFELPPDRTGDLVVLGAKNAVFGTTPANHDLSGLTRPLRSHGGLHEQITPLVLNRPLAESIDMSVVRNFDAFDLVLNKVRQS